MKKISETDWEKLSKMTDEEIDYSDILNSQQHFLTAQKFTVRNSQGNGIPRRCG